MCSHGSEGSFTLKVSLFVTFFFVTFLIIVRNIVSPRHSNPWWLACLVSLWCSRSVYFDWITVGCNQLGQFNWSPWMVFYISGVASMQIYAYITHKELAVRKIMQAMHTAYAKIGDSVSVCLKLHEANDHGRHNAHHFRRPFYASGLFYGIRFMHPVAKDFWSALFVLWLFRWVSPISKARVPSYKTIETIIKFIIIIIIIITHFRIFVRKFLFRLRVFRISWKARVTPVHMSVMRQASLSQGASVSGSSSSSRKIS